MHESPQPAILDRSEPAAKVAEHFFSQMQMLRDLANYGSNLILRSYDASQKGLPDVIVCGVLLKQIVAMVDAIEVLLTAGISHVAYLPARTAFEASLYIDFILEHDSEHRARCYLVSNYRDELLWASRATKGSPESVAFEQATGGLSQGIHERRPELEAIAAAHLGEVRRILKQPELLPINVRFEKFKAKRGHDPDWYVLAGINSISHMAKHLDRRHEYVVFYSKGSLVTHSGSYRDHLRFVGKEVRFKPVRHIAELNNLLNFAGSVAMHSFRKVVTRYRPGEISAFTAKYAQDWREPFLNAKHVTYSDF